MVIVLVIALTVTIPIVSGGSSIGNNLFWTIYKSYTYTPYTGMPYIDHISNTDLHTNSLGSGSLVAGCT